MDALISSIEDLAEVFAKNLNEQIELRVEDMKFDDNAHYLIYRVLGISNKEGQLIDVYQNKGRFLYKYAGTFLEEAAILCFKYKCPHGEKTKVVNTIGQKPKTFEIDFLNGTDALEIKWRDATTDGDHITKEHTRVQVIKKQGLKPIRVMFYYPLREQAKRIQETLKTLYSGVEGEYYAGDDAWKFVNDYTGVDLKAILSVIANERMPEDGSK